ncbi:MAG: hypothetical protein HY078_04345 [Elusimicrobia bacterium]|nr:hypothetical protein [Elusimicrobiota bacterium]
MSRPLLAACLAAPLALTACGGKDAWQSHFIPSPQLGWDLKPGSAGVDDRGMFHSPAVRFFDTVLVVGDSYVESRGLMEKLNGAYVEESRLGGMRVLLGGMTGYGPDQELLWYKKYGDAAVASSVMLLWFAGNDLADIARVKNNGGYQKPYFLLDGGRLTLHNSPVPEPARRFSEEEFSPLVQHEWLELSGAKKALADKTSLGGGGGSHSRLYSMHHYLYSRLWPYRKAKDSLVNTWAALSLKKREEQLALGDSWYLRNRGYAFFTEGRDLEAAWGLNEAILKEFRDEAARRKTRLTICLVPHLWQVDPESGKRFLAVAAKAGYKVSLDAPNARLKASCARLGIRFHDLTPPLRDAHRTTFTYDSRYSAAHWSDSGLEVVVRAIAKDLAASAPH